MRGRSPKAVADGLQRVLASIPSCASSLRAMSAWLLRQTLKGVVRRVVMHIWALRTDDVGLPTRSDNRVRFEPKSTTTLGTEYQYKNSVTRIGTPTPQ
jgi:hypothetical protein